MFEQRAPEPPAPHREGRPWSAPGTPIADGEAPGPSDRYVAIDRIDDGVATLAVAPWPTVDPVTGRLVFFPADDRAVVTATVETLAGLLENDDLTTRSVRRPLRVGDVFWVRGGERPDRWERIVDVTRAGRFAAKAALFATATGTAELDTTRAADETGVELVDPEPRTAPAPGEEPAPPPGPIAFPAV
jgi:hypothetical protein